MSRAVASPMPEVPPVTTATFPLSPRSMVNPHSHAAISARAWSFSGLDQRFGGGRPRRVAAGPSQAAGDFHAGRSQLLADRGPPRLVGESIDRAGHVDGAERRAGEVEHRHRRGADAAFEMAVAPGDAGAAIARGRGMQRGQRGRGVLAEALELLAGIELVDLERGHEGEQHAAYGGGVGRQPAADPDIAGERRVGRAAHEVENVGPSSTPRWAESSSVSASLVSTGTATCTRSWENSARAPNSRNDKPTWKPAPLGRRSTKPSTSSVCRRRSSVVRLIFSVLAVSLMLSTGLPSATWRRGRTAG